MTTRFLSESSHLHKKWLCIFINFLFIFLKWWFVCLISKRSAQCIFTLSYLPEKPAFWVINPIENSAQEVDLDCASNWNKAEVLVLYLGQYFPASLRLNLGACLLCLHMEPQTCTLIANFDSMLDLLWNYSPLKRLFPKKRARAQVKRIILWYQRLQSFFSSSLLFAILWCRDFQVYTILHGLFRKKEGLFIIQGFIHIVRM